MSRSIARSEGPAPRDGRLRVAVVGVGHLGRIHAGIWREHEGAELVGVVDRDPERARAVAAENGCAAFADARELPDGLDAASVVVPTADHARVAVPLLERGVACLVEKPIAPDLAQADAILAAAERGRAALAIGHVERFQPGVRKIRDLGLVPRFIECHRLSSFSFRSMDIGVVHDLMIHDLDLVLHLTATEPVEIDAAGGEILTPNEDLASVRLVFADGARANVTASRVSLSPMRRFRCFSADSYVSLDFTKNYGLLITKGPRWEEGRRELLSVDPAELAAREDFVTGDLLRVEELELGAERRPLQAEIDSFFRCVRQGREPEVTGLDGRRALELADRIVAEIESHGW